MGDRGQVRLVSEGKPDIYLYTHWGATDLAFDVASALQRGRSRWGDEEYLNRIIFSELVRSDIDGETGFGIGTSLHGDVRLVLEVNHDNQTIKVFEWEFDENDEGALVETVSGSFEDFITEVREHLTK